jgi:hypothetical protein
MLPEVRWRLRHIPSISNVGVGAKEVAGEVTGEFAYRVYVTLKLPPDDVPRASRIPERINGVWTDVLLASPTEMLDGDQRKLRPVKGGIQIKNQYVDFTDDVLAGTIGCLAKDMNTLQVVALSCEHVLLAGQAAIGVEVAQPQYRRSCCCCSYNVIGMVHRAVKNNQVDCAVVRLDDDIASEVDFPDLLNEVEGIGRLAGVAQAVCMEPVRKRGRTTELTEGVVVDVFLESSQILIRGTTTHIFAKRGDSGSVVVNADNEVIGLLWATDTISRTRGIANHIGPVMQEMGILIAGQTNAGLVMPSAHCPP